MFSRARPVFGVVKQWRYHPPAVSPGGYCTETVHPKPVTVTDVHSCPVRVLLGKIYSSPVLSASLCFNLSHRLLPDVPVFSDQQCRSHSVGGRSSLSAPRFDACSAAGAAADSRRTAAPLPPSRRRTRAEGGQLEV